jgi:hypothetical protein
MDCKMTMIRRTLGLFASILIAGMTTPIQAATLGVDLAFTENSSDSLELTINGQSTPLSLVSPDHWVVNLGLASRITKPLSISFREPNAGEGWNVVTIDSTQILVAGDQPSPSGTQVASGGTFTALFLGQPGVSVPLSLLVRYTDKGDTVSIPGGGLGGVPVPDTFSARWMWALALVALFALKRCDLSQLHAPNRT